MTSFCTLAVVLSLAAPPAEGSGSGNDALRILQQANEAAARLTAIAYEAEAYGEGGLADRVPHLAGRVLAKRGATDALHKVLTTGTILAAGSKQKNSFQFATDGRTACSIDSRSKTFAIGMQADARSSPLSAMFPPKYLHGAPFRAEMQSGAAEVQGAQKVNGVPCDVIRIKTRSPSQPVIRLFLGQEDHLLRRIEKDLNMRARPDAAPTQGRVVFTVKSLDTQPKIDDGVFRLSPPKGYQKKTFKRPPPKATKRRGLLPVGSVAPDWQLKTPEGNTVRLSGLRGKFVVLDFWATWCGWCKRGMPSFQKLHNRFKGKPVIVFGVNCKERSPKAKPMDFIKSRGFTYPQLLNGTGVANAYGVGGIPVVYVIGPDGKILYAQSGYDPNAEAVIGQLIEKHRKP